MKYNLKRCPFCGGRANFATIEREGRKEVGYDVSCSMCGASVPMWGWPTKLGAASLWNARTLELEAKTQKDAARLDWLESGERRLDVSKDGGVFLSQKKGGVGLRADGAGVRFLIDYAMSKEKP